MTFTENMCGSCETSIDKNSLTIGQALERCLSRAVAGHRVTVGIQECAKLLGCAPERVMLCIIPDMAGSADVGMHIQHTLVRSFCWENEIRLLSVKNCEKLQNLVNCARAVREGGSDSSTGGTAHGTLGGGGGGGGNDTSDTDTSSLSPPSCLLVEMPPEEEDEDLSAEEDFVCSYHDTVICSDIYPKPIIQLPV